VITGVGDVGGTGAREIDAEGMLVTPGWVDIHTHYDGQVTWDSYLSPSCWHGVTTVVMGNCGVGFAPARPDRHEWLIGIMEAVEDIPGSALAEGMKWDWETFPEYLDSLERRPRVLAIATKAPHSAIRAYVMDERGARNEVATPQDIAEMARITREAVQAGALGFSTSRTALHRTRDGEVIPGTFAGADEMVGIGRALGEAGHGVFELASDMTIPEDEFAWMAQFARETGLPVNFSLLQSPFQPDKWRDMLALTAQAQAQGADIKAGIACRPTGMVLGWQSTVHPFMRKSAYRQIAHLPFAQRLERLRDPAVREAIIGETTPPAAAMGALLQDFGNMLRLERDGQLDYEPRLEDSVAAQAAREGLTPEAVVYDMLMENDGRGYIYLPLLNYARHNFDHIAEMMDDPNTILSLSDGGAHCGVICDASFPTYMLTYWVRDRVRGRRMPLEKVVSMQTRQTAALYGLHDRGVIAPGMKADLNVIDFDALAIQAPEMIFDLPADGRRLIQKASGYRATVVSGVVTFEDGEATGEMPGKLIRGPQAAPAALAAE